jgi:nucleotide-binding universal stress UspA family protein
MQRFRNILVALSCSDAEQGLLAHVAMLARFRSDARFHLVHVLAPAEAAEQGDRECWLTRAQRSLSARAPDALVFCAVVQGDRLDSLLRYALHQKMDLVMLGHRKARRGRRSLARRLAMKAPCSVWLVPEGAAAKVERVLAPVDFSARSGDAMSVAASIAAAAASQRCYALHVRFDEAAASFDEFEEIYVAGEQEALALFLARIDLHGVEVEGILEQCPSVAGTILRVAREKECDLIVMGTRGRSRAASVLLGSETEQVLREAAVPVLAVKHFGAKLRLLQTLLEERFRHARDLRFT